MTTTLDQLNNLNHEQASALFSQCCTASRWISKMAHSLGFSSMEQIHETATRHWETMEEADFLEAFDGHPKIGDPASLKAKYAKTHSMASNEQSSVEEASDETISALAQMNSDYEARFGFIFIVCATGKSADEMLALVRERIHNDPKEEIHIAANEQLKILHIRIDKCFTL